MYVFCKPMNKDLTSVTPRRFDQILVLQKQPKN